MYKFFTISSFLYFNFLICSLLNASEMSKENAYKILNIEKNSTQETIKKSYKKLALQWHPDRNHTDKAKEMFQKISAAYKILFKEESETSSKLKTGLSFEDNLKIQMKIDEIIKITHEIDELIRNNNDFISQSFINLIQAQKLNLNDKRIKQTFKGKNIDAAKALKEQSILHDNLKQEILKNKKNHLENMNTINNLTVTNKAIDELIKSNNDLISQNFMDIIQDQKLNLNDQEIKKTFKNRNSDATKALNMQLKLHDNIKKEILKNKSFTTTNHTFIVDYNNDRYNSLQNEESYNNHLERDFHNVAKLPLCYVAAHDVSFENVTKEIASNENVIISKDLNTAIHRTNIYKTIACLGFNLLYNTVHQTETIVPTNKEIESNVINTWAKANKKNFDINQKRSDIMKNTHHAHVNNIPEKLTGLKKDLISEHNELKKIVKIKLENEQLLSAQINEKNKWAGRAVGTVTVISLLAGAGYIYSKHQ